MVRATSVLLFLLGAACASPRAIDAGPGDAGVADAGSPDAGPADAGTEDGGPTALRVLFIGDSYTFVNDLPGMLQQMAATAGVPPLITTGEVVQGGATLEVQWENGLAQAAILDGGWTQVVLQGQSEEPLGIDSNPADFFQYARQFGDLIVDAGAQPTLFATWARAASSPVYGGLFACQQQMQDELTYAYAQVAQDWPESILVCVGQAFQQAIAQYPAIDLQQADFSHPTVAGTYLAASTFYVALTGRPVPSQSAVPAGLSDQDAANLRTVAQIGSNCADVRPKGVVATTFPTASDAGPPYDFGTAGTPVAMEFQLANIGSAPVGISDGMTLAPPFVWSAGGSYPGGSGIAPGLELSFCSSSLAPNTNCAISVTYTGAATGSGELTLDFTDAYFPTAIGLLSGTTTDRALLTVCTGPGFIGCNFGWWTGSLAFACAGETASINLFVLNRGALPITSLEAATALTPPFAWASGVFPGGTGDVMLDGASYSYCSATLGAGEQCVISIAFSPTTDGGYSDAVDLAYGDSMGPVSPDANLAIGGTCNSALP